MKCMPGEKRRSKQRALARVLNPHLRGGFLTADLICAPRALDLALDLLNAVQSLVRRHVDGVQLVNALPNVRVL
jgi:hypothetical protein